MGANESNPIEQADFITFDSINNLKKSNTEIVRDSDSVMSSPMFVKVPHRKDNPFTRTIKREDDLSKCHETIKSLRMDNNNLSASNQKLEIQLRMLQSKYDSITIESRNKSKSLNICADEVAGSLVSLTKTRKVVGEFEKYLNNIELQNMCAQRAAIRGLTQDHFSVDHGHENRVEKKGSNEDTSLEDDGLQTGTTSQCY